jgi:hypothetical protein
MLIFGVYRWQRICSSQSFVCSERRANIPEDLLGNYRASGSCIRLLGDAGLAMVCTEGCSHWPSRFICANYGDCIILGSSLSIRL